MLNRIFELFGRRVRVAHRTMMILVIWPLGCWWRFYGILTEFTGYLDIFTSHITHVSGLFLMMSPMEACISRILLVI